MFTRENYPILGPVYDKLSEIFETGTDADRWLFSYNSELGDVPARLAIRGQENVVMQLLDEMEKEK